MYDIAPDTHGSFLKLISSNLCSNLLKSPVLWLVKTRKHNQQINHSGHIQPLIFCKKRTAEEYEGAHTFPATLE